MLLFRTPEDGHALCNSMTILRLCPLVLTVDIGNVYGNPGWELDLLVFILRKCNGYLDTLHKSEYLESFVNNLK